MCAIVVCNRCVLIRRTPTTLAQVSILQLFHVMKYALISHCETQGQRDFECGRAGIFAEGMCISPVWIIVPVAFKCWQVVVERSDMSRKRKLEHENQACMKKLMGEIPEKPLPAIRCGPADALKDLRSELGSETQRQKWIARARIDAILGSCPKSLPSVASGIRAWLAYATDVLRVNEGDEFPPTLSGLLTWSMLFRSRGTFRNYLGYARVGCALAGKPCDVFNSKELDRALKAVEKRGGFNQRGKMFVRMDVMQRLAMLMATRPTWKTTYMWILTAYVFMLRVPSECLPISVSQGFVSTGQEMLSGCVIAVFEKSIELKLATRKNRPKGSHLKR